MKQYAFDIESDGLLPEITKIHSLVLKDLDTGETISCTGKRTKGYQTLEFGLKKLSDADLIVGHNIITFDLPAIRKLYPKWKTKAVARDTILLSRLIFADLKDRDFRYAKKNKFPLQFAGRHSLESWGHRIGNYKGDFKGPWETWTKEMQDYCEQDVNVTAQLWHKLKAKGLPEDAIDMEHRVGAIVFRQEQYGWSFDEVAAGKLYARLLKRRDEINAELQEVFPPLTLKIPFLPKVNNKKYGYIKGEWCEKTKIIEFNPGSRDHIAQRLQKLGWKPRAFGKDGKPTVDEEVLEPLQKRYPQVKLLLEYLMIDKRIGQLAEGKEACLKKLATDGAIHGRVDSVGAVTRRMTHSKPNVAQTPAIGVPYGKEFRALYVARRKKKKKLVGCDAAALELRCLAGYMAKYDGGAYIDVVLRSDDEEEKKAGRDLHSLNAKVLGCSRADAKTWFYAFIYGSGDANLGRILGKNKKAGEESRAKFLKSLPALEKIIKGVKGDVRKRGHIISIDGVPLHSRSEHSALNTLLQSAGAIFMKRAQVILDDQLQKKWKPGVHYEFVGTIHDEWQIEVDEEIADEVGRLAAGAIALAGDYYKFKCPLAGNYVTGNNWADTH
ncbi:DNA polymerase [Hyphomicrobium sp. ghe19]|uniref:DNA polymerase n=1 Tax=Hyphomicrobium sp. ghe19 TaxID=2682968 RepID=UPI0013671645|nr:DNA polymerase I, thermostable [Hyphomicrobium sp. ghe19]